MLRRFTVIALAALGVAACGGAAIPTEQMTAAQAALRAAEVGGAQENPQASLHLKHASDQIESARLLIEDGENERALWVLRRAEVDAEVALALAKEQSLANEARAAMEELERMKKKAVSN
jgi:hypothetical protein